MIIKRFPEDFLVEECLADAWTDSISPTRGAVALYRLTKSGLTTPEAIGSVAKSLKIHPKAFDYAGLKDKYARTIQHITCTNLKKKQRKQCLESMAGPGWEIERLGWVEQSITSEAIARNRFSIVVREISEDALEEMDTYISFLSVQDKSGASSERAADLAMVNYFGDQRFGSARHGQGFIARHLLDGDFQEALRLTLSTPARKDQRKIKEFKRKVARYWGQWPELLQHLKGVTLPEIRAVQRLAHNGEDFCGAFAALPYFTQQIAVYAYQARIWNGMAAHVVKTKLSTDGDLLETSGPFGNFLFPKAREIQEHWMSTDMPVLGKNTEPQEPWGDALRVILEEEGLSGKPLRIPGLRRPFFGEAPRPLIVRATNVAIDSPTRSGEKERTLERRLRFELPRGAYATVLLRALGAG